ncbi:MAG: hypothetical protein JNK74_07410 [Candidatus Hydrogenedentes bacterium]|nr:hypothetical protein [Candidatus Hydrogenedentota bacterium]
MFWEGDEPPTEYYFQDFRSSPGWLRVARWYNFVAGAVGLLMLVAGFIVTVKLRSWHGGSLQVTGGPIMLTGLLALTCSIPRVRTSYYIFAPTTFKLRMDSMKLGLRGLSESTFRFMQEEIASATISHATHLWRFPMRRESVVKIRYSLLDGSRHGHELFLKSWDSVPIPANQLREYLVFLGDLERCLTTDQLPDKSGLAQAREAIQQSLNRLGEDCSTPGDILSE